GTEHKQAKVEKITKTPQGFDVDLEGGEKIQANTMIIATGSDFGGGSVRAGHLAWEIELLVGAGLEPHEALAAATRNGGALYGVDHAGRIEEGMPADLVLVHGDPLSDPRAMWRVWAVYQAGVRVA
ncbi:MAG: amidohydrolase family protein, partial [Chloroflexota bacterium]